MSRRHVLALLIFLGASFGTVQAGPPEPALSASLRALVLEFLPDPLYDDHRQWGLQKPVTETHWRGQGLNVHPEKVQVLKNDGHWHRVLVTAKRAKDTLVLDLRDLQTVEPGRVTFTAHIALDTDVDYEKQRWNEGLQLHGASLRARMRVHLTLWCEATTKIETSGKFLPDAVIRVRVVRAAVGYDHLVVEHVAGVGGEAAKLFGESVVALVHQWKPSIERRLLDKASAAIVKAGDTKEVRLSLSKWLGK